MPSIYATLRALPLSLLLATAVSAAPGRKCRPASSAPSITDTAVSVTQDQATGTPFPTSTASIASTSEDSTTESSLPTLTLSTATLVPTPELTTITSCPPTPTYNGSPAGCFAPGNLFAHCKSMTAAGIGGRILDTYASGCRYSLLSYATLLAPAATTCWPANGYVANTVTASSVYDCLAAPTASLICSSDSNCATSTYTVGEEPTPVPTIGVNLIPDPSFESGTMGNWTVTQRGGSALQVSVGSARSKTGDYSLAVHTDNTDGFSDYITINGLSVVPGASYRFSYSALQTNANALTSLSVWVFPQVVTNYDYNSAPVIIPNQWQAGSLTFTAATSWVNMAFLVSGNLLGTSGSAQGINDVYIDDVSFVRLS